MSETRFEKFRRAYRLVSVNARKLRRSPGKILNPSFSFEFTSPVIPYGRGLLLKAILPPNADQ